MNICAYTYALYMLTFISGLPRLKILTNGWLKQNFGSCVPIQWINMVLYLTTLALKRCLTSLWMVLFVLYLEVNEECIINIILWWFDQTYLFCLNDFRKLLVFILFRSVQLIDFFCIQSSLQMLVDQPWILIMGLLLNMVKTEMLTWVRFLLDEYFF